MKKRYLAAIVIGGLLLLIVVPMLFATLSQSSDRELDGVSLSQVTAREVTLENTAAGIQIAGLLFEPEGDGPFPAAVMIHGSGTSSRENRWYLTIAHQLQQRGIAVLLPDKRGCGGSGGDWKTSSFQDLATDTAAAVAFLDGNVAIAVSTVGIIGLSQGGHIAPLAASQSPETSFVVNIVGSVVPMRESVVYEETHNLRQLGLLPGISDLVARCSSAYLVNISQAEFWQAIDGYDPMDYWRRLEVPALVLYGDDDTNVDSTKNAKLLRSIEKPNIEIVVMEGSGHALSTPIGEGNSIIREDALERVADMVRSVAETQSGDASSGQHPK